jgi:hypothetical protein
MTILSDFLGLVALRGSEIGYRRVLGYRDCNCVTPEGFRNPRFHLESGQLPVCNEEGKIPTEVIDVTIKGFCQPIQSTRATRLTSEVLIQLFGEVQADDHLVIAPCVWEGLTLDFMNWSQSGDEFIYYDGQYYLVINANKIPDPETGDPNHHWEAGLRKISTPLAPVIGIN